MFGRFLRRMQLRYLAWRQRRLDKLEIGNGTWWITCRELEWQTIKTGHLNVRPFVFVADEFTEMKGRRFFLVGQLLKNARDMYGVMRELGPGNYELPADYIDAQIRHFDECGRCQRKLCEAIRFYAAIDGRRAAEVAANTGLFVF